VTSKKHWWKLEKMMFLNWMRCGHLFPARTTNAGYGQRCVVALCKWLPSFLATIVLELVPNCGRKFLKVINAVTPSVISGFEVENPQPLTDSEYLGFSTSKAYAKVFPKATHRMVGKEAGETHHLIACGHRRIAHITGPLAIDDSRARLQGYQRALEAAGISFDERLVIEADFHESGGRQATQALLKRQLDFTAIFVGNDQMATGALDALKEAGLTVPDDISLIGFDDVLFAQYLTPKLTTIRQPLFEMGQAAAQRALDLLGNKETEVKGKFDPELVIRQSVKTIK
jgi:ABC-type sugar transport system substrate-binding protein